MACHINIVNVLRTAGFTLLPVLASLCSCRRSGSEAERGVKEWLGKEIVFPDSMVFTVQGDTVDYRWQDAEYKIVTFVDSMGCTECKLKLPMWNHIIESVNTYGNIEIPFIMIVDTNDAINLAAIAKRNKFMLPITTLSEIEFIDKNGLPKSARLQTFFINEKNEIMVIGNPILFPDILNLYKALISHKQEF